MPPYFRLLSRTIVICLGLLASLALTAMPARAGSWSVSYECSGTSSDDYNPYAPWSPTAAPYYWVCRDVSPGSDYNDYSIKSDGTVTATLTWNPQGANDPPPSQVYVVESSFAGAWGGITNWGDFTNDVDDGLGDPVVGNICCGSKKQTLSTGGRTSVRLPQRHLSASTHYPEWFIHDLLAEAVTIYSVSLPDPPKSVMIGGPGGTQEYVGGAWMGKGDTRFSNDVIISDFGDVGGGAHTAGTDFGPVTWSASLIGSGWPTEADFVSQHNCGYSPSRTWEWQGGGAPTDGEGNYTNIATFQTDRPKVHWPFAPDSGDPPRDNLELMDSPRVPPTQEQNITFRLTDNLGPSPDWDNSNFSGGASYRITFHNEYELIHADDPVTVPAPKNPWHKIVFATNNSDIQTLGKFDGWSPSLYFENGGQWDFHINGASWSGGGGGTTNTGYSQNVTPQDIPLGSRGVVYGRLSTISIHFTYNHFLVGGREMHHDNDGKEIPFDDSVVRPRGGFGTADRDYKTFVFGGDEAYPGTINHD